MFVLRDDEIFMMASEFSGLIAQYDRAACSTYLGACPDS